MSFSTTTASSDSSQDISPANRAAQLRYKYTVVEDPKPYMVDILFVVMALRIMAAEGGAELLNKFNFCEPRAPHAYDYWKMLDLEIAGFYPAREAVEHMFAAPVANEACGYGVVAQQAAFALCESAMETSEVLVNLVVANWYNEPLQTRAMAATRILQCIRARYSPLAEGFGLFIINAGLFVQTGNYELTT